MLNNIGIPGLLLIGAAGPFGLVQGVLLAALTGTALITGIN